MLMAIVSWFPPVVWTGLMGVLGAAGVDMLLTVALSVMGKLSAPFQWRLLPQFLSSNVLPAAVGLILGACLVKYEPDLQLEYLAAVALMTAWLARDWRSKWKLLMGFVPDKSKTL